MSMSMECKMPYEREIQTNLKRLTRDKELSDVIFQVGPLNNYELIYGIRSLFAVQSPVFRSMLIGERFIESIKQHNNRVIISDVTPESFKYLRNTFYSVKQSLKPSIVVDVLYLSQKYLVSSLEMKCLNYIKEIKGLKSFAIILKKFETQNYSKKKSNEYLNNIICNKPISYILSKKCKKFLYSNYFLNLNIDTIIKIISSDYVKINECDIFKASLKYSLYHSNNNNSNNNNINSNKITNNNDSNNIMDDLKEQEIELNKQLSQISLDDDDYDEFNEQKDIELQCNTNNNNIGGTNKIETDSDDDGDNDDNNCYFNINNNEIKGLINEMIINENMRIIFKKLVKYIRFPIMNKHFFIEFIKNSNITLCKNPSVLNERELIDIFTTKLDKRQPCGFISKERLSENTDSFCLNEFKLTLNEIYNLKVNDEIDFRDQYGLFCSASVIAVDKNTKGVKIHYHEWSDIYDEWIYYDVDGLLPNIIGNNSNNNNNNNNNENRTNNIDDSNGSNSILNRNGPLRRLFNDITNNNNNSNNTSNNNGSNNNNNDSDLVDDNIVKSEKDYSTKQQMIVGRFAKFESISNRKVKRKEFQNLTVNNKVLIKYPDLFIQKYEELSHLRNKWVQGNVVSYRMEKKYSNHVKVRCEINQDHYDWWFHPDNDDEIKPYKHYEFDD